MDIKQLRYFKAVVTEGGFSGAAAKLHLSQPSLSKAIRTLEGQIGFQLFERTTKRVDLTESGRVFYERAVKVLAEMDIFEKEVIEVKAAGSGEVRLGMIESVKNWIPDVLGWYRTAYPDMRVVLKEVLGRADIEYALRNHDVHACLTNERIDEPDIVTQPLYTEKLVLVMHAEHRLASQPDVRLADVAEEPFIITGKGFQTRSNILQAFEEEGLELNLCCDADRFETILTLVEAGIGVSIIPRNYLGESVPDTVAIRELASASLDRTVYLASIRSRYRPPAVEALLRRMGGEG
ncbi:LysR family transcriptional regulator [Sporosarcina sp. NCCP-2716]|uniref:LysR family transcriptional regulator n=1 Tax=Sporosarcina sp. NCCP-2716 TaxID=2943679 RepID=UPI002041C3FF|nr:LysR family transcriptional regulator [Sporosarcina sp. NCCP-2716]GKV69260.1 LysR family transcriptional regulator [Sporosarcina sp. NCCP-2716]